MSALTLSFHSSCVNTNMLGVKNVQARKKNKGSSGAVIILCTMHSHDRLTSTLISHNFTQQHTGEWAWGLSVKSEPDMAAKAVNAFFTMGILCWNLCFSEINQSILGRRHHLSFGDMWSVWSLEDKENYDWKVGHEFMTDRTSHKLSHINISHWGCLKWTLVHWSKVQPGICLLHY